MMYYSHKQRFVNPGVSRTVPGIENQVKSMVFVGLTLLTIYVIINTIN